MSDYTNDQDWGVDCTIRIRTKKANKLTNVVFFHYSSFINQHTWGGGATRCPDWRSPLPNAILQASRGEEGGENQDGGAWGRMEAGGSFQSFYFQTKSSNFQSICELDELNEKKIVWMKVKVFIWILSNFQWLVSCGLAGLPQVPVFSRVGGDEMTQMKVKVLSHILILVNFSCEYRCLIRSWGRKYSYDDSINSNT